MNVQNPTDSAAAVAGGSCTLARAPGSKRVNQKNSNIRINAGANVIRSAS